MRSANGLYLSQSKYIKDLLNKTKMADSKSCLTSIVTGKLLPYRDGDLLLNPKMYQSTVGVLQYLTITRP